jgi:xanthine dehydrogenase accessory factor
MTKELELWTFIAAHLKRAAPLTLLVVAESSGSSPGRQGFKMAVTADGMFGSIGGGVMEVNLVNNARQLLSVPPAVAGGLTLPSQGLTGKSTTLISVQTHQKNSPSASGMICSGRQTVIFKLLTSCDAETIRSLIDSLENRKRNILTITPDDLLIGPSSAESPDFYFESASETDFVYRERLGYKNQVCIIGGGHCALALSELMSRMDFYIRVFDDRPDLNTVKKNTFAHEKHLIERYETIGEKIPSGSNVYVVVMTLGFASDQIVIRQLLDKTFKYFGVLGSTAKMAQLLRSLEKEGQPKEKLGTIRTPIGIPINSQTPEEIAISIAAEIISEKNS